MEKNRKIDKEEAEDGKQANVTDGNDVNIFCVLIFIAFLFVSFFFRWQCGKRKKSFKRIFYKFPTIYTYLTADFLITLFSLEPNTNAIFLK